MVSALRLLVPVTVLFSIGSPLYRPAPADDPAHRLQEILRQLEEEQRPWYADFHVARAQAEREQLLDEVPGREFVESLRALAEEAKGTDVALSAWSRLYGLGKELRDETVADAALTRIVSEHLASARLEGVCQFISSWARPGKTGGSIAALRKILAGSPHRHVQAAALNVLAVILAQSDGDAACRDEARALFGRLGASYADIGDSAAAAATGLFELDHLQIGMHAPDFEAVDQSGTTFTLSDSKDRVVLIDFWGSW